MKEISAELKENNTEIVNNTDIVISRELLDEVISCLSDYDNEIADELFIKLYHLRGEK